MGAQSFPLTSNTNIVMSKFPEILGSVPFDSSTYPYIIILPEFL